MTRYCFRGDPAWDEITYIIEPKSPLTELMDFFEGERSVDKRIILSLSRDGAYRLECKVSRFKIAEYPRQYDSTKPLDTKTLTLWFTKV